MNKLSCVFNKAKYIVLLVVLLTGISPMAIAQYQLKDFLPDTSRPVLPRCDTTTMLADSVFKALKSEQFDSIKRLLPTMDDLKFALDSMGVDDNIGIVGIKYQYWVTNIQKDFTKLKKECDLYHLSLKHMKFRNYHITEGTHKYGESFARIVLYCERNNKYFAVSFVALKLVDHWFLADDLELIYEKKPRVKKIPSKFWEGLELKEKPEETTIPESD